MNTLHEKLKKIVYSRRCSDHYCIWGHPGGLGTNGGCQSLKLSSHEAKKELRLLAKELRELLEHEQKT